MSADLEDPPPARPVLVVDDSPDVRDALVFLLQSHGFRTAAAADGLEAKALLEERRIEPCLIVLDLAMPRMDGFEFRTWQIGSAFADVPVIVFSGVFDIDRVRVTTGLPAFRKSDDPDAIVRLVHRHCARDGRAPG